MTASRQQDTEHDSQQDPQQNTQQSGPSRQSGPDPRSGNRSGAAQGSEQRSEGLLPAADGRAEDGRFEVAEEVNLDQQSDAIRHVGRAPRGIAADALADSLERREGGKDGER